MNVRSSCLETRQWQATCGPRRHPCGRRVPWGTLEWYEVSVPYRFNGLPRTRVERLSGEPPRLLILYHHHDTMPSPDALERRRQLIAKLKQARLLEAEPSSAARRKRRRDAEAEVAAVFAPLREGARLAERITPDDMSGVLVSVDEFDRV